jgi:DNA processing protein
MLGPIQCLTPEDPAYPELLRVLPRPPCQLYCIGNPEVLASQAVAVVGSRHITAYGRRVVGMLVPDLVEAGLTVVSGLAYGVDGESQRCAVRKGGVVVAVLAGGLDKIYPSEHQGLAEEIVAAGGCLVSEYPPGTPSERWRFTERNRIIAGLVAMVVIIEAGERSGTLSTARHALDAGREVGVVPADITRTESLGTGRLLRDGARPIISSEDILCLYGRSASQLPSPAPPGLTGLLGNLYDVISHGSVTTDQLLRQTGLPMPQLQGLLTVLELEGHITLHHTSWQKT